MSETRRFHRPRTNSIQPLAGKPQFAGRMRRWHFYAIAVVVGVLALAWIDGGEEPLRPIAQQIEAPGQE